MKIGRFINAISDLVTCNEEKINTCRTCKYFLLNVMKIQTTANSHEYATSLVKYCRKNHTKLKTDKGCQCSSWKAKF